MLSGAYRSGCCQSFSLILLYAAHGRPPGSAGTSLNQGTLGKVTRNRTSSLKIYIFIPRCCVSVVVTLAATVRHSRIASAARDCQSATEGTFRVSGCQQHVALSSMVVPLSAKPASQAQSISSLGLVDCCNVHTYLRLSKKAYMGLATSGIRLIRDLAAIVTLMLSNETEVGPSTILRSCGSDQVDRGR